MKRTLTTVAGLAVVLLCTACAPTATTGGGPEHQPVSTSPAVITVAPSLSTGGRSQAPGGTVRPNTGIAWNEESKTAAGRVAAAAMADYARPKEQRTRWANDFARWLTPQAVADYSTVDPANIPASRVTGTVTLTVDESNGYGATATVPTNAGPYTVQLLRTSKDSPWKVNRLTPPPSR